MTLPYLLWSAKKLGSSRNGWVRVWFLAGKENANNRRNMRKLRFSSSKSFLLDFSDDRKRLFRFEKRIRKWKSKIKSMMPGLLNVLKATFYTTSHKSSLIVHHWSLKSAKRKRLIRVRKLLAETIKDAFPEDSQRTSSKSAKQVNLTSSALR